MPEHHQRRKQQHELSQIGDAVAGLGDDPESVLPQRRSRGIARVHGIRVRAPKRVQGAHIAKEDAPMRVLVVVEKGAVAVDQPERDA